MSTQSGLFRHNLNLFEIAPHKGSSGSNTTTQSTRPPEEVMQAYKAAFNQAQNVAAQPYVSYTGATVAGFTPMQQTAFDNINTASNAGQPFVNAASQYATNAGTLLNPENFGNTVSQYQNPFTDNVVNSAQQVFNQQNATQQADLTGNAIAAGAWGGDRANIAKNDLAFKQALAQNSALAGLQNQGWNQSVGAAQGNAWLNSQTAGTMSGLGQTAQGLGLQGAAAQMGAGTAQQQLAQQQLNVPYQQFQQASQYPFQTAGWLSNVATGLGSNMGGTSSTTQPGPSGVSQAVGGVSALTGLLGLFLKDGGAVHGPEYADGGAIAGLSVPDFSISIVPDLKQQKSAGMGPPRPPAPTQPDKGSGMPDMSSLGGLGNLLKPKKAAAGLRKDPLSSLTPPDPNLPVPPIPPPPEMIPPEMPVASPMDMLGGGTDSFAFGGNVQDGIHTGLPPGMPQRIGGFGRYADGGDVQYQPEDPDWQPSGAADRVDDRYSDPAPTAGMSASTDTADFDKVWTPDGNMGATAGFGDDAPVQTAAAPPAQQAGLGAPTLVPDRPTGRPREHWLDRVMNSPSGALIAMGLGIMSGSSPHAGVNIGKGALSGLSLMEQMRTRRAQEDLAAERIDATRDYRTGQLGVQQQRANTAQNAVDNRMTIEQAKIQGAMERVQARNAGRQMSQAELQNKVAEDLVRTDPEHFPTISSAYAEVRNFTARNAVAAGRLGVAADRNRITEDLGRERNANQLEIGRGRVSNAADQNAIRLRLGEMAQNNRSDANQIRRDALQIASDDRERGLISRSNDSDLREATRAWSFAGGRGPLSKYLDQVHQGRSGATPLPERVTPAPVAAPPAAQPTQAAPPPAAAPATQTGGNPALDAARAAIQRGAPRDAVINRLRAAGIDPAGL